MKAIPVASIKGGVGKTTVCAQLGLALKDKGYRVGFLDCDLTGATLPLALGIPEPFPYVGLDTEHEKMIAVSRDGYEVFSLAFRFGKAALLWKGGEQTVRAFGREFHLRGTGRYELIRQMLSNVQFGELDFLCLDLPPTSGDETLSLWEHLKDIWGIILVCQPTSLSVLDIERALNMIEVKKLPLLGMVGSMTEVMCPSCHHTFSPYLDGGVDLVGFCERQAIPYLGSIPIMPNKDMLTPVFTSLADKVLASKPVEIWRKDFTDRVVDAAMRGFVKGLFK